MSRRRTRSRVIPESVWIRRVAELFGRMVFILHAQIAALPPASTDDRPTNPDVPF